MLLVLLQTIAFSWAFDLNQVQSECGTVNSSKPAKYCIFKTPQPTTNVVYFFHGSGGDEVGWMWPENETFPMQFGGRRFYKALAELNATPPTIIGVSFGASWSLAEVNSGTSSGYFGVFVDELMPKLEEKLGYVPTSRDLVGLSMGGGNVLQLLLKRPALFRKAILACPQVLDVPPYDPDFINLHTTANGADPAMAQRLKTNMGAKFPDEASWKNFSPLDLGPSLLNSKTPAMFISVSPHDEFGFFKPVKKLVHLAVEKDVNVTWAPFGNRHCDFDHTAGAKFLIR